MNSDDKRYYGLLHFLSLTAFSAIIVLVYGSFGRPIWFDEFLFFALGAQPSASEAWGIVKETTTTFNHGQTGFYMMLDYSLLQLFGANLTALRFPSLISALWLLMSGFTILKVLGLHRFWQYFYALDSGCGRDLRLHWLRRSRH